MSGTTTDGWPTSDEPAATWSRDEWPAEEAVAAPAEETGAVDPAAWADEAWSDAAGPTTDDEDDGWPDDDVGSDGPFGDIELDERGLPTEEAMKTAMRAVMDPEIGLSVVDLGLVYNVSISEEGQAHVRMTLTTMGCPLTDLIHQQATLVLTRLPHVTDVDVEFTFDPPWSTDMIEPDAKEELRAMGLNV